MSALQTSCYPNVSTILELVDKPETVFMTLNPSETKLFLCAFYNDGVNVPKTQVLVYSTRAPYVQISNWSVRMPGVDWVLPGGIAVDAQDVAYVTVPALHCVFKVSAGTTSVFAGQMWDAGYVNGPALTSKFSSPGACVVWASGLYLWDAGNYVIRRVTLSPSSYVNLASGVVGQPGYTNYSFTTSTPNTFTNITAMTISQSARGIVVTDNNSVRLVYFDEVTGADSIAYHVAGVGGQAGYRNTNTAAALFDQPKGVVMFDEGKSASFIGNYVAYVADTNNNCIRRVSLNAGVDTVAGSLQPGYVGQQFPGGAIARFNAPEAMVVFKYGRVVWVWDASNSALRALEVRICGLTTCVDDFQTAFDNCGGCSGNGGATCASRNCQLGVCECPVGEFFCPAVGCVNLDTDARHCGKCDIVCPAGQKCQGGGCVCDAVKGETVEKCYFDKKDQSQFYCARTLSDPQNCGKCGIQCGVNEVCVNGQCVCPPPLSKCDNGDCINKLSSLVNCGTCGSPCDNATQICSLGSCICAPSKGYRNCGEAQCTNVKTSANHCGLCQISCTGGKVCSNGFCVCPQGQTACGGVCTSLQTDAANCGACGAACGSGQLCRLGQCVPGEPAGGCFPSLSWPSCDPGAGVPACSAVTAQDACCLSEPTVDKDTSNCPPGWTCNPGVDYCTSDFNALSPDEYRHKCHRA
jgi:hypothetical protein